MSAAAVATTGHPENDGLPKVFAGNLPFSATEESLKAFFKDVVEPKYATIIHRGTRSLGYGFVAFANEADAQKAAEACNQKEMDGRLINCELAKVKDASEPRARRPRGERGRGRGRGRGGRGGAAASAPVAGDAAAAPAESAPAPAPEAAAEASPAAANGRGRGRGARRPRAPRAPRPAPTGDPSPTTLFVANLPFKLTDDDLKGIFAEYKVASAHVVRMKSGRSKGFGFVELASEEEQKRVLSELKNVKVGDRELALKVALSNQVAKGDEEEAAEAQA